MKKLFLTLCAGLALGAGTAAQTALADQAGSFVPSVETLVCIRHGEKPATGLGQLSCRGLNRALALPKVLLPRYSKPQFVFAPNPGQKSESDKYFYIRPLMTIEPTAIQCGLPVNTQFGFKEIEGLEAELLKERYKSATVYVAWEHVLLDFFAKSVLKRLGGDPKTVPPWASDDFDSIFVIRITTGPAGKSVAFSVEHEGLNNLGDDCP